MTVLDILLSRASVSALQEPAPNGRDLDMILECGLRAPDHGGLCPWRFVVIRGAARDVFADNVVSKLKLHDAAAPQAFIARQRAKLTKTPLIIALGVRLNLKTTIPEIEQTLSVGAAAMNMLNAIYASGYGGIWVTGPVSYDPHTLGVLGFESTDKLVGFLLVGTAKEEVPVPRRPDIYKCVMEWKENGDVCPYELGLPRRKD